MEKMKKKELATALGYNENTKKTVSQLRNELAEKLECAEDEIEQVLSDQNSPADEEAIQEEGYASEQQNYKDTYNQEETADEYLLSWEPPCGAEFDPNPDAACHKVCKEEDVELYQKCMSKYQLMQKQKESKPAASSRKSTGKKKTGRKKQYDIIGDGVGTSASMINSMLICGASIKEMEDEVEVPRTRIMGHFNGLKAGNTRREPKEITRDKETGRYFIDDPSLDYYGDMNEEGVTPVEMIEICRMRGERVDSKKKEPKENGKKNGKKTVKSKAKAKSQSK